MRLISKVTLFSAILAGGLLLVLTFISQYSFRQYLIASASEQVRTAAEIVRVHLTESMIHGVIDKREGFLTRLREVSGFKSARVVRAPPLIRQFPDSPASERNADPVEQRVFASRQPIFELTDQDGETVFRGTIPYIASTQGVPNCLNCHQVQEGDVLGAVSITLSIEHLERLARLTAAGISAAVVAFVLLAWFFLRRMLKPISETAQDVERAVQLALQGDFSSALKQRTDDEIGHIAHDLNRLLRYLGEGLGRIGASVVSLLGRPPESGKNQLQATIEMVDILAQASHFKQAIEEDETRAEIHARLGQVLRQTFSIHEYSLYEAVPGKPQLLPLLVDGEANAECRWCDAEILVRSDACRAKRTGHAVDGVGNPGICNAFKPSADAAGRQHICLPIIQSGTVGNVLQIVVEPADEQRVNALIPFVAVYLDEAAPVLESKRLMETLREANLRDPMTGLNNRRFLEEYIETLVATTQRREGHLALLMLDLDYFKMINDNHGHDAGDAMLKALAKTLRQSVRASDMVIRYGGEEFLIILQNTSAEEGQRVAEKIRLAVEGLKVTMGNGTVLQKTISIGLADFPDDSPTFWQALKFADVALYKAKESGRNRVVRFTPELWDENQSY